MRHRLPVLQLLLSGVGVPAGVSDFYRRARVLQLLVPQKCDDTGVGQLHWGARVLQLLLPGVGVPAGVSDFYRRARVLQLLLSGVGVPAGVSDFYRRARVLQLLVPQKCDDTGVGQLHWGARVLPIWFARRIHACVGKFNRERCFQRPPVPGDDYHRRPRRLLYIRIRILFEELSCHR